MTQEKLEYIKQINIQLDNLRYLFINGEINSTNINSLYHYDKEFKEEMHQLREKYLNKYNKLFKEA